MPLPPVLIPGDCRDAMLRFAGEGVTFHSIVCDPPYDLVSIVKRFGSANAAPAKHGTDGAFARASKGFMGKQWDGTGIAFDPFTWSLAYDCLPPGGHLVAFGGSRTWHRMACAIEDAGFEIRDTLCWLYGTGFPKSHDISKAIDKAAGAEREVTAHRPKNYADTPSGYSSVSGRGGARDGGIWHESTGEIREGRDVTAPATPEAAQWAGWGTALKPAFEPIILARKPLDGTVAANVLKHGTGAINIDACRIEGRERTEYGLATATRTKGAVYGEPSASADFDASKGRWPANVLHDGSDEVEAAFAAFGESKSTDRPRNNGEFKSVAKGRDLPHITFGHADSGTASRFFYSAKASKADRAGSKHPTVKPLALMRWLCRLVTPPGGRVLDPFAGSGSTLQAAYECGFDATGCEAEPEYQADIQRRIDAIEAAMLELFLS